MVLWTGGGPGLDLETRVAEAGEHLRADLEIERQLGAGLRVSPDEVDAGGAEGAVGTEGMEEAEEADGAEAAEEAEGAAFAVSEAAEVRVTVPKIGRAHV